MYYLPQLQKSKAQPYQVEEAIKSKFYPNFSFLLTSDDGWF
jgi:hypothetical protein|tara:strand:- start:1652 stop:1774 length:123 start_codon:yes stop_codon:yes gene_type:complete